MKNERNHILILKQVRRNEKRKKLRLDSKYRKEESTKHSKLRLDPEYKKEENEKQNRNKQFLYSSSKIEK